MIVHVEGRFECIICVCVLLYQIRAIDRKKEVPHDGPMCDLLWSDPEGVCVRERESVCVCVCVSSFTPLPSYPPPPPPPLQMSMAGASVREELAICLGIT